MKLPNSRALPTNVVAAAEITERYYGNDGSNQEVEEELRVAAWQPQCGHLHYTIVICKRKKK